MLWSVLPLSPSVFSCTDQSCHWPCLRSDVVISPTTVPVCVQLYWSVLPLALSAFRCCDQSYHCPRLCSAVLISPTAVCVCEQTEQGERGPEHSHGADPEHPEGGGGKQAEWGGAVAGVQHPGHGRVLHGHHLPAGGETAGESRPRPPSLHRPLRWAGHVPHVGHLCVCVCVCVCVSVRDFFRIPPPPKEKLTLRWTEEWSRKERKKRGERGGEREGGDF